MQHRLENAAHALLQVPEVVAKNLSSALQTNFDTPIFGSACSGLAFSSLHLTGMSATTSTKQLRSCGS